MKILKSSGWFLLAVLSHILIYQVVQGLGLMTLGAGGSIYGVLPLYIALSSAYVYLVHKWYRLQPVRIQTTAINRSVFLPALLWLAVLVVQFFLPNDPSTNQVLVEQLVKSQPVFSFFMVVIFAPLTEELIFRGMLARYLFQDQKTSKQQLCFLLVSSVIFSLIHIPATLQQFAVYTMLGLSLGWAYVTKKDLSYGIFLHALNNFISFLMILML